MRAALVALLLAACTAAPPAPRVCAVPTPVPDAVDHLGCARDYELLGSESSPFTTFARTRVVGVILDRESDTLHFLDTSRWWLHFDYVFYVLEGHAPGDPGYNEAHRRFNTDNYTRDDRRYLLGKIVDYQDQGLLVYELAAGDLAGPDLVREGFTRVRGALFDGARLRYRAVSARQEADLADLADLPLVSSDELFAGQVYQPLNPAVGYGTLRFRRAASLGAEALLPGDIVVLDRVPFDIPVVSGIITAEFQAPLSHVNILAKGRGTPNMALRGAFTDPGLRAFEGQLVKLTVAAGDYGVEPTTLAEAEASWEARRPTTTFTPRADLSVVGIVDLADAGLTGARVGPEVVGQKAACFAELARVPDADGVLGRLPRPGPARAIPFSAFAAHMRRHGLDEELAAIVAKRAAGALDNDALAAGLFDLRRRLYAAPLDPDLAAALEVEVAAMGGKARFRSSTNVEDLAAFSGAGLYVSATGELGRPGSVANAVKTVWASAFSTPAFLEREYHRVTESGVAMAVLFHPPGEDEAANGVAVTTNDYSELRPAFQIDGQKGEISVSNPTGLAVPEQLLYYTWYAEPEIEVLARSSLNGGAPLLSDDELARLGGWLGRIHAHFRPLVCDTRDCALDVEWKLGPGRELLIKQARPYR